MADGTYAVCGSAAQTQVKAVQRIEKSYNFMYT